VLATRVALAMLPAVVLAACTSGINREQSSDPPSVSLSLVAVDLRDWLEITYPDSFAGLAIDHARNSLTVYRKTGSSLDDGVRARVGGVNLEFRDARFSAREMRELAERIMSDREFWRRRDADIQVVGPAVTGAGVEVTVPRPTSELEQLFSERY